MSETVVICEVCEDTTAIVHCQECRRKTCEECDEILHLVAGNKLHRRVSLFPSRSTQSSRHASYAPSRERSRSPSKRNQIPSWVGPKGAPLLNEAFSSLNISQKERGMPPRELPPEDAQAQIVAQSRNDIAQFRHVQNTEENKREIAQPVQNGSAESNNHEQVVPAKNLQTSHAEEMLAKLRAAHSSDSDRKSEGVSKTSIANSAGLKSELVEQFSANNGQYITPNSDSQTIQNSRPESFQKDASNSGVMEHATQIRYAPDRERAIAQSGLANGSGAATPSYAPDQNGVWNGDNYRRDARGAGQVNHYSAPIPIPSDPRRMGGNVSGSATPKPHYSSMTRPNNRHQGFPGSTSGAATPVFTDAPIVVRSAPSTSSGAATPTYRSIQVPQPQYQRNAGYRNPSNLPFQHDAGAEYAPNYGAFNGPSAPFRIHSAAQSSAPSGAPSGAATPSNFNYHQMLNATGGALPLMGWPQHQRPGLQQNQGLPANIAQQQYQQQYAQRQQSVHLVQNSYQQPERQHPNVAQFSQQQQRPQQQHVQQQPQRHPQHVHSMPVQPGQMQDNSRRPSAAFPPPAVARNVQNLSDNSGVPRMHAGNPAGVSQPIPIPVQGAWPLDQHHAMSYSTAPAHPAPSHASQRTYSTVTSPNQYSGQNRNSFGDLPSSYAVSKQPQQHFPGHYATWTVGGGQGAMQQGGYVMAYNSMAQAPAYSQSYPSAPPMYYGFGC